MDEIFGYIEGILFSSDESGFTVAKLKEPKKREVTPIVGALPSLQPGESIRAKGQWRHHAKHGRQFEVSSFEVTEPADLIGIQKYLESGMIKGIGPVYAKRIVTLFGLDTLKIIDTQVDRLLEVEGIGKKRIETIAHYWDEQKGVRDVMIFLRTYDVSPAYAQKIYKRYGQESIDKVRDNPYILAKEIRGIGFKSADKIALSLGIARDSDVRIDAALEHLLWELSNDGHTCYPRTEMLPIAMEMLGAEETAVQNRIEALIKEGRLVFQNEKIWLKPLFAAEEGIAHEIKRLFNSPSALRSVDVQKALPWVQEKLKIALAPEQSEGVAAGISEKLLLLTGGPGTGKSTITNAILSISEKLTGKISLAAPTGRAAKRMSEITKKKAQTIHALLEVDFKRGGFKHGPLNPLDCDLLIVDEASMIDTFLLFHLLRAIPSRTRVIFVGDVDQLPSVGPGNTLKDLIESGKVPVKRLQKIFRQAEGSRIVTNAHLINRGEFPDLRFQKGSDFIFIGKDEPEEIAQTIVDLIQRRLPREKRFHRFRDIQVLCPMKRGVIGTENLNQQLQNTLNPSPAPLMRMGRTFHKGDKVMQLRNNYQKEVYNGDVGFIISINTIDGELTVAFDEKLVTYDFSELDELILSYAVSIHKYQGSECPCIIIPIHTSHFKLLFRNLLYTGITRGKKLVILIGSKKAIAMAIAKSEVQQRYTGLKEALEKK